LYFGTCIGGKPRIRSKKNWNGISLVKKKLTFH
jgi:hypothetical protein